MSIQPINDQIVRIRSQLPLVTDADSALSFFLGASYETGVNHFIADKAIFCEEFFSLSSGLAGEILQKCINYHIKLAIMGDFSGYTSKPLQDFIRESNRGRDVFFLASEAEATDALMRA